MADSALLELNKMTAKSADEARQAAQAVAARLHDIDARVAALEAVQRVRPADEKPSLAHRALDKVAEKPIVMLYAAAAFALATGGPAALGVVQNFTKPAIGADHGPVSTP